MAPNTAAPPAQNDRHDISVIPVIDLSSDNEDGGGGVASRTSRSVTRAVEKSSLSQARMELKRQKRMNRAKEEVREHVTSAMTTIHISLNVVQEIIELKLETHSLKEEYRERERLMQQRLSHEKESVCYY